MPARAAALVLAGPTATAIALFVGAYLDVERGEKQVLQDRQIIPKSCNRVPKVR